MHIAPMSIPPAPNACPCRISLATPATRAQNPSYTRLCTKKRSAPMQFWPQDWKAPRRAIGMTCGWVGAWVGVGRGGEWLWVAASGSGGAEPHGGNECSAEGGTSARGYERQAPGGNERRSRACSTSASSQTMKASLPPSSRTTGVSRSEAACRW